MATPRPTQVPPADAAAHALTMATPRPSAPAPPPPTVVHASPESLAQATVIAEPEPFSIAGYVFKRLLGRGGMGEVYLAVRQSDVGVGVPCVVKTILADAHQDPTMQQLFLDEVRLVAGLRHPNLVSVMDVGRSAGRLYQTIEWVEGMDLERLSAEAYRGGDRVPLKHLLYIFREVLQGLHYVHAAPGPDGQPLGIVHRDISPGNILISKQGAVKLADFGVALMTAGRSGVELELAGKPAYFAPELWRQAPPSAQTDIFAMGVTLYEMMMLKPLFRRTGTLRDIALEILAFDPQKLLEQDLSIPDGVETLLLRSLAPKPADRYASALEFLEDVNDYCYEYGIRLLDAHFARYVERMMSPETAAAEGRKPLFRNPGES